MLAKSSKRINLRIEPYYGGYNNNYYYVKRRVYLFFWETVATFLVDENDPDIALRRAKLYVKTTEGIK